MDPGASPTDAPSDSPRDPLVGALIGERYRLLGRIGEGGMGAVYRAEHVLMKKVVALKLLHAELGRREPDIVARLHSEAARWYEANAMPETDPRKLRSSFLSRLKHGSKGTPFIEAQTAWPRICSVFPGNRMCRTGPAPLN
jgi:serine/threonine protein kinase